MLQVGKGRLEEGDPHSHGHTARDLSLGRLTFKGSQM